MNFVCDNRKMVLDKIHKWLPLRRLNEESEVYYGKLNKKNKYIRKFRLTEKWLLGMAKSIWGGVKSVVKTVKTVAKKGVNLVAKGLTFIKNQVIKFFFAAKNFIVAVIKALVTFFKDVLYTLIKCFLGNATLFLGTTFALVIAKLRGKFTKFNVAMSTGVVLIYLANEFLGYLCMKTDNRATNKVLLSAFKATDENKKAVLMGEGLASMVKTFAYSE